MRSRIVAAALASTAVASLAYAAAPVKPPAAKVEPVTETLFGQKVIDNYRYMEALGPDTIAWMKAQGAYTRSVLDAIKPLRGAHRARLEIHRQLRPRQGYATYGGRDVL